MRDILVSTAYGHYSHRRKYFSPAAGRLLSEHEEDGHQRSLGMRIFPTYVLFSLGNPSVRMTWLRCYELLCNG